MQQKLHFQCTVCHLTVWRLAPLLCQLRASLWGPSVSVTRAGVIQESHWKRINHLWKWLCSVAADDSWRVVRGWQQAWGPHRLPFFMILPGSCGGNGCKSRLCLPPVVHHKKAKPTQGQTNWITGGDAGAISDFHCVLCWYLNWGKDKNDGAIHFDCNISYISLQDFSHRCMVEENFCSTFRTMRASAR